MSTEQLEKFIDLLGKEDKGGCIELTRGWLEKGEIDILTLYSQVLAPALNHMFNDQDPKELIVWKEHTRSSIVRAVIENCFTFIEKAAASKSGEKVVVICPPDELHEIGARMVADIFTIEGYDVTYIGANTPLNDFLSMARILGPRYIAISVTNHYNLVALERIMTELKKVLDDRTEIIVGGRAFQSNPDMAKRLGAHRLLLKLEDLSQLKGGS